MRIATMEVTVSNVYEGKNAQIIGAIVFVIGLFATMGSCSEHSDDSQWFLLLAAVGLLIYMAGRIRHWYHAE